MLTRQAGVDTVPTFVTPRGRVVGYLGKSWLLEQLEDLLPAEVASEETVETTSSAEPTPTINDAVLQHAEPFSPVAANETDLAHTPGSNAASSTSSHHHSAVDALAAAFTIAQWLGIIGGSAATGGVGTIAVWGLLQLIRRRRARRSRWANSSASTAEAASPQPDDAAGESVQEATRAPFPRQLDEACELLALGRSEGRVAVLDTLRGMFLDDELDKFAAESKEQGAWSKKLRDAIDARVNEVAPLSAEI